MNRREEERQQMETQELTGKDMARQLFLEGEPVALIAEQVGRARSVIYYWIAKFGWRDDLERIRRETAAEIDRRGASHRADLVEETQEALAHGLREAQRTRARRFDEASKGCLNLGKLLSELEGTRTDGEERRGFSTMQELIFVATGAVPGSDRIPRRVEE